MASICNDDWASLGVMSGHERKTLRLSRLYLEASGVPAFVARQGGPGSVLFLDVRSRAEAMFVGMAANVDAQVPFVDLQELMTDWDAQRNAYRLEPLQDFVPEVGRRLEAKAMSKTDVVILICRSGDRSSRAANRLAEDSYTRSTLWSMASKATCRPRVVGPSMVGRTRACPGATAWTRPRCTSRSESLNVSAGAVAGNPAAARTVKPNIIHDGLKRSGVCSSPHSRRHP